jgi:hypothetical protein
MEHEQHHPPVARTELGSRPRDQGQGEGATRQGLRALWAQTFGAPTWCSAAYGVLSLPTGIASLLLAHAADADRLYGVIFMVVAFSVLVQGGLVPGLAHRLGVPLRTVEPEPWSLGCGSATSRGRCGATGWRPGHPRTGGPWPTCRSARRCGSAW